MEASLLTRSLWVQHNSRGLSKGRGGFLLWLFIHTNQHNMILTRHDSMHISCHPTPQGPAGETVGAMVSPRIQNGRLIPHSQPNRWKTRLRKRWWSQVRGDEQTSVRVELVLRGALKNNNGNVAKWVTVRNLLISLDVLLSQQWKIPKPL